MGEVVKFELPRARLERLAEKQGAVEDRLSRLKGMITNTQTELKKIARDAEQSIDRLDVLQQRLKWTSWFCDQCATAVGIENLQKMEQRRDELVKILIADSLATTASDGG